MTGRILGMGGDLPAELLRIAQQLQREGATLANYRATVETAGRIYCARLEHYLRTAPAAPPRPEVIGGGDLPPDVVQGLGLAHGWDHDAEARQAIGESWNLSVTFQQLLPQLARAAAEEAGGADAGA